MKPSNPARCRNLKNGNSALIMQEIAFQRPKNSNISGGACPRIPLIRMLLRPGHYRFSGYTTAGTWYTVAY